MFKDYRVLAIIPARGGSKGLPEKNLRKIGGRTLVEWALFAAQGCPFLDRIIVSSDSKRIINKVNKHGLFAPFVRPSELARDETPSLPVFQHALNWAETEDHCRYDYIVVLEPPCPFRLAEHIKKGLEIGISSKATSVMSLVEVSDCHPVRIKRLLPDNSIKPFCMEEPEGLRRQEQEPAYIRNSAVYVFSRKIIVNNRLWGNKPYGFIMEKSFYAINIDVITDLYAATGLYKHLKRNGKLHYIDTKATAD